MNNGKLLVSEQQGVHLLKFVGDVRLTLGPTIDAFLSHLLQEKNFKSLVVDLTETVGIDSTSLGLLVKVAMRCREHHQVSPTIISTNEDITRILLSMGMEQMFMIVREPMNREVQLGELQVAGASDEQLRKQVLEAHQVLMSMNEHNRSCFRDLVEELESDCRRSEA